MLMWVCAATGITLFSIFYHTLPRGLGTSIYLLLGWIAGAAGLLAWRRHGSAEVKLLLAGGAAYSVGAILLAIGWPTIIPGVVGPHEVWHIAVLVAMGLEKALVDGSVRLSLGASTTAVEIEEATRRILSVCQQLRQG